MILATGLLWGVVLAALTGGRLERLKSVRLRFEGLILAVFVLQSVARSGAIPVVARLGLAEPIWALSSLALLAFLLLNPLMPMRWLFSLGISLNLFVVLINGGMPVLATVPSLPSVAGAGEFYHRASIADQATLLADILPLPGGWLVSLGDLVLVVASAAFLIALTAPAEAAGAND